MKQENTPITKRFYTVRETAQMLSIAPQTIYNALSDKSFPIKPKRLGKSVRFDIRDIEAFIENLCT